MKEYTATIKEEVETKIKTMKLKKTTTKTETTEVDVQLPYFSKTEDYHFAILSEDDAIRVQFKEYGAGVSPSAVIAIGALLDQALKGSPITQKEFEDAYVKASDFLADKFETMRDKIEEKRNEIYDNEQKEAA